MSTAACPPVLQSYVDDGRILLSPAEVAAALGVKRGTIDNHVNSTDDPIPWIDMSASDPSERQRRMVRIPLTRIGETESLFDWLERRLGRLG